MRYRSLPLFIFIFLAFSLSSNAQNQATALDFDGNTDYVALPNGIASNFTSGQMTGSAWVYLDSNGIWSTIMKNWGNLISGLFHLGMDVSTQRLSIYITQSNNTLRFVVSPTTFPINQWVHTAFVADGTDLILYQNAIEIGRTTYDGTLKTTFPATFLGAKPNDTSTAVDGFNPGYWDGIIDEVRLFNRALSQAEIMKYMNCELVGDEENLVAYYKFNQGLDNSNNASITSLDDLTANSFDGTLISFALDNQSSNWVEGLTFMACPTCEPNPAVILNNLPLIKL